MSPTPLPSSLALVLKNSGDGGHSPFSIGVGGGMSRDAR